MTLLCFFVYGSTPAVADIFPGYGGGFLGGWADLELPDGTHRTAEAGHGVYGWEGLGGSAGGNRNYEDANAAASGSVYQGAWQTYASIGCSAFAGATSTETIIATAGSDGSFGGGFSIDAPAVYSVSLSASTSATGNFAASADAGVSGPNLYMYVSASGASSKQVFPTTLMILTPGDYFMSASAHAGENAPETPGSYGVIAAGSVGVNYVAPVPACGYLADGDMNGDMVVNGLDVQAMVECLLGAPTEDEICHGDFNMNETLDTGDISGMASALLRG